MSWAYGPPTPPPSSPFLFKLLFLSQSYFILLKIVIRPLFSLLKAKVLIKYIGGILVNIVKCNPMPNKDTAEIKRRGETHEQWYSVLSLFSFF